MKAFGPHRNASSAVTIGPGPVRPDPFFGQSWLRKSDTAKISSSASTYSVIVRKFLPHIQPREFSCASSLARLLLFLYWHSQLAAAAALPPEAVRTAVLTILLSPAATR